MKTYTAKDLLEIYMDLYRLDDQPETWAEEKFADNGLCLYRYRQVIALIKAFNLDINLRELSTGQFVKRRSLETYPKANELVKIFFTNYSKGFFLKRYESRGRISPDYFSNVYHRFFRFLQLLRPIFDFNSGVLESSMLHSIYAVAKTGAFINEENIEHLEDMKNVMAALIDPADQVITEAQLIEQYSFPQQVEFRNITDDWL